MSKIPTKDTLEQYRLEAFNKHELLKALDNLELECLKSYVLGLVERAADLYMSKIYYPRLNSQKAGKRPESSNVDTADNKKPLSPLVLPTGETISFYISPYDELVIAEKARADYINTDGFCYWNTILIDGISKEQQSRIKIDSDEIKARIQLTTQPEARNRKTKDRTGETLAKAYALKHVYLLARDEGKGLTSNGEYPAREYGLSPGTLYKYFCQFNNKKSNRTGLRGVEGQDELDKRIFNSDTHKKEILECTINLLNGYPKAQQMAEDEYTIFLSRYKALYQELLSEIHDD